MVLKLNHTIFALVLPTALMFANTSLAKSTDDPANLSSNNLFTNPGFDAGKTCFDGWNPKIQNDKSVICRGNDGTVWLNHNNRSGDPAVAQTVTGLDTSKEYTVRASWRAGDTAGIYAGFVPQKIFAIKIGDHEAKTFITSAADTDWKTSEIKFTPDKKTMTFEFRGEAGPVDGDVKLQWVSLRSEEKEIKQKREAITQKREAITQIISAGTYLMSLYQAGEMSGHQTGEITIGVDGSVLMVEGGREVKGFMRNESGRPCIEDEDGLVPTCYDLSKDVVNGVITFNEIDRACDQKDKGMKYVFTPKNYKQKREAITQLIPADTYKIISGDLSEYFKKEYLYIVLEEDGSAFLTAGGDDDELGIGIRNESGRPCIEYKNGLEPICYDISKDAKTGMIRMTAIDKKDTFIVLKSL